MDYGISESIPQRSDGEKTKENFSVATVANEIDRRCKLHEAELRGSQKYVSSFELEQRIAEEYAKENALWIPMDDIFSIGVPGPSGNENDTYVSGDTIFKVNNLLNSGGISKLLHKILLHNAIFPETSYTFYGFTGYDGRSIMPVFKQALIRNSRPATKIEIDTYMAAIGFVKCDDRGRYSNEQYLVWDVVPRNVLREESGDMFIIDAEIKML